MLKGKLKNGFEFEVNERIKHDYFFVEKFAEFMKSNESDGFPIFKDLMIMLLGEEQMVKFVESFREKDGIVPVDTLSKGFRELLDLIDEKDKEIKN